MQPVGEMEFTGERYVPNLDWPELSYEHWHRYLYASQFVAGKSVLDIACGEGYGSNLLAGLAKNVVGVDSDLETVKHASGKYSRPNLEFRCGTAETIPIQGKHLFDVVVSFETLEHLEADNQLQFANEIKRLLKPEGILLISTPNKLFYTDKINYHNEYHRKEFYVEEFAQWLKRFFRVVHLLGQRVYPISYVWPLDVSARWLGEHQIGFANGGFKPLDADSKESLYVLAVCSDVELQPPAASVLIDISERAIRQWIERVAEKEQAIQSLVAQVGERQQAVESLTAQLAERQQAVESLTAQLTESHQKVQSLVAQVGELEQAVESLTAQLAERQQAVESLTAQLAERQQAVESLTAQLAEITNSKGWKLLQSVRDLRLRLAPRGTLRDRALRFWMREGTTALIRRGISKFRRRARAALAQPTALGTPTLPSVDIPVACKLDVICFSIIDWNFRFQRPQQLLTQFARDGHRVFYLSICFAGLDRSAVEVRSLSERIYELVLPGDANISIYRDDLTQPTLGKMLAALREFFRQHSVNEALCLVQHPFWTPLVHELKAQLGCKVVYDCMDEHSGFQLTHKEIAAREEELGKMSDLVVVSSQYLNRRWSQAHANCILIPNAGDYTHFSQLPSCASSPIANLPRPVIGYYGAIAEWFDANALHQAATLHPEWSFVLIGHTVGASLDSLRALPNVHLLGEKTYAELPAYLAGFDVCTIPFRLTPLTEATNPVKVFEELCAGKPVVATALPELESLSDVVYQYATPGEFVSQLERALVEDSASRVLARQAVARQNTWEERCRTLKPCIESLYSKAAIIIITWNNLKYTQRCIESVLADQTWPNYELIIVDNASNDGTVEYFKSLAEKVSRVKIVLNEKNLGFAAANNVGLRYAKGSEFVVLLNNDTVVPHGWLARLLRHARKLDVGIVGPVTNWAGNEAKIDVSYTNLDDMESFAASYVKMHEGMTFEINTLAMFCVAMRSAVVDQIGPLDERFSVGMFEDDDYARRVRQAGYRVICAEDVFVHHHGMASFGKLADAEYRELFERNRWLYEEKWGEPWVAHQYRNKSGED
jgi:GT2 family glycosyltransferase/SAM-dependent methyltransferase/glycosyltransferase involved in cell wall biosynthesis